MGERIMSIIKEVPTGRMRFVIRRTQKEVTDILGWFTTKHWMRQKVLQHEWSILSFSDDGHSSGTSTEWRDVPEGVENE
jgi:hypothetical protein